MDNQIDNYGRIISISTSDLLSGMDSIVKAVESTSSEVVNRLNKIASKSTDAVNKFNETAQTLSKLSNEKELQEIISWLSEIHKVQSEIRKNQNATKEKPSKPSTFREGADFKNITSGFEKALDKQAKQDPFSGRKGEKLISQLMNMAREATTGHSLHVHDYTAANLLTIIAKDIKHIGLMLKNVIPGGITRKDLAESFNDALPDVEKKGYGRRRGENAYRRARARMGFEEKQVSAPHSSRQSRIENNIDDALHEISEPMNEIGDGLHEIDEKLHEVADALHEVAGSKKKEAALSKSMDDNSKSQTNLAEASYALFQILKGNSVSLKQLPQKMENLGVALEEMGNLTEPQIEKISKAVQRIGSMDKGERKQLIDEVKTLQEILEDPKRGDEFVKQAQKLVATADRTLRRQEGREDREAFKFQAAQISNAISNLFHVIKDTFSPHMYGLGTEFDPIKRAAEIRDETNEFTRKLHLQLAQSYGMQGSLIPDLGGHGYRQADDPRLKRFFETIMPLPGSGKDAKDTLAGNYNITGQDVTKIQTVALKNLSRGVTMQERWNKLTRQGLQLGRMIGVDAEQTADELADWHLHMGFTVTETGQLMRDMQSISKITGLTGEKLFEAVKASKQLADHMRSAGTLTGEAAKNMMQYTAAASRRGTEQMTQSIMEAIAGSVNLFQRASPETFALVTRAAQMGGVMQQLQEGTINQDRRAGKAFAQGMQQVLFSITGGRRVEQLSPREKMALNLATQATFGKQLNEIQMIADTLKEAYMSTDDKIQDINEKLKDDKLPISDRMDLEMQRFNLQRMQTGENMNEAMRQLAYMGKLTESMSVDSAAKKMGIDAEKNIRDAIKGIRHAADHLKGPQAEEEKKRLDKLAKDLEDRIGPAMGDSKAFQSLLQEMDEVIRGQQIWERMYQLDQSTFQKDNQERHQREMFENMVRNGLLHIMAWSPPEASLANTYLGLVAGFGALIAKLATIYMAIVGLRTMFGAGGITAGGLGGRLMMGARIGAAGLLAYDAYQGYNDKGMQGAMLGLATGSADFDMQNAGKDSVMAVGRGAAIGALYGGPVGAAVGAIVAASGQLAKAFISLESSVNDNIKTTNKAVDATHEATKKNYTSKEGQARQATNVLKDPMQALADAEAEKTAWENAIKANKLAWEKYDKTGKRKFHEQFGDLVEKETAIELSQRDIKAHRERYLALLKVKQVEVPHQLMMKYLSPELSESALGDISEKIRTYLESTDDSIKKTISDELKKRHGINIKDLYGKYEQELAERTRLAFLRKEFESSKLTPTYQKALENMGELGDSLIEKMKTTFGDKDIESITPEELLKTLMYWGKDSGLIDEAGKFTDKKGAQELAKIFDAVSRRQAGATYEKARPGSTMGGYIPPNELRELEKKFADTGTETAKEAFIRGTYGMSKSRLAGWGIGPDRFYEEMKQVTELQKQLSTEMDEKQKANIRRQLQGFASYHIMRAEKIHGDWKSGSMEETFANMSPELRDFLSEKNLSRDSMWKMDTGNLIQVLKSLSTKDLKDSDIKGLQDFIKSVERRQAGDPIDVAINDHLEALRRFGLSDSKIFQEIAKDVDVIKNKVAGSYLRSLYEGKSQREQVEILRQYGVNLDNTAQVMSVLDKYLPAKEAAKAEQQQRQNLDEYLKKTNEFGMPSAPSTLKELYFGDESPEEFMNSLSQSMKLSQSMTDSQEKMLRKLDAEGKTSKVERAALHLKELKTRLGSEGFENIEKEFRDFQKLYQENYMPALEQKNKTKNIFDTPEAKVLRFEEAKKSLADSIKLGDYFFKSGAFGEDLQSWFNKHGLTQEALNSMNGQELSNLFSTLIDSGAFSQEDMKKLIPFFRKIRERQDTEKNLFESGEALRSVMGDDAFNRVVQPSLVIPGNQSAYQLAKQKSSNSIDHSDYLRSIGFDPTRAFESSSSAQAMRRISTIQNELNKKDPDWSIIHKNLESLWHLAPPEIFNRVLADIMKFPNAENLLTRASFKADSDARILKPKPIIPKPKLPEPPPAPPSPKPTGFVGPMPQPKEFVGPELPDNIPEPPVATHVPDETLNLIKRDLFELQPELRNNPNAAKILDQQAKDVLNKMLETKKNTGMEISPTIYDKILKDVVPSAAKETPKEVPQHVPQHVPDATGRRPGQSYSAHGMEQLWSFFNSPGVPGMPGAGGPSFTPKSPPTREELLKQLNYKEPPKTEPQKAVPPTTPTAPAVIPPPSSGGKTPEPPKQNVPTESGNDFKDMNYWYNVNRVEDMIWQYIPNLDMMRTQQIAIASWNEYTKRVKSGKFNENTMKEIISQKLKGIGVTMPDKPATQTPFGEIAYGPNGMEISKTPGWSGATQIGGDLQEPPFTKDDVIKIVDFLGRMAAALEMGTKPGSFYVSDTHMQNRFDDIDWTESSSVATTSKPAGLDQYEKSRYYQDLDSVEVSGPLSDATEYLDEIEENTRNTAKETKRIKELLAELLSNVSNTESSNKTTGNPMSDALNKGNPPNYWSWELDMSSSPNYGSRRPNGVT